MKDPEVWVRAVERLQRVANAAAVSALCTANAVTVFGNRVIGPAEVYAHPPSGSTRS